jgi:predicted nucleotidyltransferase
MELGAVLIFLRNLGSHNADYVLVGGAALNVLGIVRATEDVDIFIEPSVSNIIQDEGEHSQASRPSRCGTPKGKIRT